MYVKRKGIWIEVNGQGVKVREVDYGRKVYGKNK